MGFRKTILVWALLVSSWRFAVAAEDALDAVAMRNGDIHQGAVAIETLALETPYGTLALPYGRLANLTALDPRTMRVETLDGERFTGRPLRSRVTVLRVVGPPLQLHVDEIADIRFAARPSRPARTPVPDVVEMHNGDIFRARLEGVLLLVPEDGKGAPGSVALAGVGLMDAEPGPDGKTRAMLRPPGGGPPVLGTLASSAIVATLGHGDRLDLDPAGIASLSTKAVAPDATGPLPSDFAFPRTVDPARIFRDRLRDGGPGPEMVRLEPGRFLRGEATGNPDPDETPVQLVDLKRPFAIGRYEVTFEEYDRFRAGTGRPLPGDAGWGRGRRPVIDVSWDDARAYVAWLSEQTGARYRLPSDAEWEYAARGGTMTRFWWGDEIGAGRTNCAECSSLWAGEKTAPVGRFPPNPFGLFDTAGNLFEWVADCWHDRFAEAPADGSPMEKPAGCGQRVFRGGAWSFPAKESRSANRWRILPGTRSDDIGFRVARDLDR
jgi:formylglycine-generating enzyme required for sulfatase activity